MYSVAIARYQFSNKATDTGIVVQIAASAGRFSLTGNDSCACSICLNHTRSMTIDERLDRLTGVVEALPATVVAHDNQIDKLIDLAQRQSEGTAAAERRLHQLRDLVENMGRQWQAYLNTLPRQ